MIKSSLYLLALLLILPSSSAALADSATPVDFKVAFFGDLGTDKDSIRLLKLVKTEGTDMVIHLGDIDYAHDPAGHAKTIDRIFGPKFPYLMLIGNHDKREWYAKGGYKELQEGRLRNIGIKWEGELGTMSTIRYKGLSIFMVSPGITGSSFFTDPHADYLKENLKNDPSIWKICVWHKNQHKMQVTRKGNETYWGVYETCRKNGAFIGTGHSHSYSRTHLLKSMKNQKIASTSNNLEIRKGRSFAFVSGLGGGTSVVRRANKFSAQYRRPTDPWWASVYTSDNDSTNGALFCEFNKRGVSNKAACYFKNIRGEVIDQFTITSGAEK
jgi:predicted phosphodiesterase